MCYHPVELNTHIKADAECCMELVVKGTKFEVCPDLPTNECKDPMKEILKKLYTGCK